MRRFSYLLMVLMLFGMCIGCEEKVSPEAAGQIYLQRARASLAAGRTSEAKALIDSLRKRQPKALNAREEGILLLDSVLLTEAQHELDSLEQYLATVELTPAGLDTMDFNHDELKQKVRFFEKKLDNDRKKKVRH